MGEAKTTEVILTEIQKDIKYMKEKQDDVGIKLDNLIEKNHEDHTDLKEINARYQERVKTNTSNVSILFKKYSKLVFGFISLLIGLVIMLIEKIVGR